jgi:hypothetical protein
MSEQERRGDAGVCGIRQKINYLPDKYKVWYVLFEKK